MSQQLALALQPVWSTPQLIDLDALYLDGLSRRARRRVLQRRRRAAARAPF